MRTWLLFLCLTTTAFADPCAQYYSEKEDGHRPRCLETPDAKGNWFFTWDESEKWNRDVEIAQAALPCRRWKDLPANAAKTVLKPADKKVGAIALEACTQVALKQVRLGAKKLRGELLAADWLKKNPVETYTIEKNRELTNDYGGGFAGDVYAAWLRQEPENAKAEKDLLKEFEKALEEEDPTVTNKAKSKDIVALYSLGMGWDPKDAPPDSTMAILNAEMLKLGVETKFLKNHPMAGIPENVEILTKQIVDELATGKDVILVGLCKGSPELLGAFAAAMKNRLDDKREQKNRPRGDGRVLAFLNVSGLIGGTYIADKAKTFPKWLLTSFKVKEEMLKQMESMTSAAAIDFNKTWVGKLPSDVVYTSLVGIVPETGMNPALESKWMAQMRGITKLLKLADAAHDGFIEYPKQAIPTGNSTRETTIVIEGSHVLWEGYLGRHELNSPKARRALFSALFRQTLDRRYP